MAIENVSDLACLLKALRHEIGHSKDIPTYWLEYFLLVAASGDRGIRTIEIQKELDMVQGIASRLEKLMSLHLNKKTHKMEGLDIFEPQQDHEYRHQKRLFLSKKGRGILEKLEDYLYL